MEWRQGHAPGGGTSATTDQRAAGADAPTASGGTAASVPAVGPEPPPDRLHSDACAARDGTTTWIADTCRVVRSGAGDTGVLRGPTCCSPSDRCGAAGATARGGSQPTRATTTVRGSHRRGTASADAADSDRGPRTQAWRPHLPHVRRRQ
jgi:hypothetical protein